MYKVISYYNQNRKTIWKVILAITLFIIVLQILNYYASQPEETNTSTSNSLINNTTIYNSIEVKDENSVISGSGMSTAQIENIDIMDEFYDYCNSGQVDLAYNLLSDSCKEEVYYNKIDNFEDWYVNSVFEKSNKIISIENWFSNTYKVGIKDNPLSTGSYSDEEIRDYITIVKENDEYKLNINNYIGKTELEVETIKENITISVISKDTYMDYEVYSFEIYNGTENTIILDDLVDINSMYIVDKNDVKYNSDNTQLYINEMTVKSKRTISIDIKYYSKYTSTKEIEDIVFSNIILDINNNSEYYKFEIYL